MPPQKPHHSPNLLSGHPSGHHRSLPEEKNVKHAPSEPRTTHHAPRTGSPLSRAIPPVKESKPPEHHPRKRSGKKRWIVLATIVIAVVLFAPVGYALGRAGWSALAAKAALERAATLAQRGDAEAASEELKIARDALADARDAMRAIGIWRDVPGISTQVRALEDAAAAGASTLDGVQELAGVAGDILDAAASASTVTGELVNPVEAHRSFNDLTPEEKRAILARLSRALPDIRAAQAKVDVALDTWNRIPQNALFAPLRSALAPVAENLPKLKRSLDEAVPLLELFLPLAGYPKPAEYLVVLQNSDEMRATGGFLGTWGILGVDGGDLKRFEFNDVYSLDNPASGVWKEVPPAPLRERLGMNAWFFRDANWSPDFSVSAQRLSDFYVRETYAGTGKTVGTPDGVLALNSPLFKGLLRITGPIKIEDVTFTADNFFEVLEYEVEQRFLEKGIAHGDRKQILIDLGDELLKRLTSLPARQWPDLLDLLTESLNKKDTQLYVRDPSLLAQVEARGWSGRTIPTNGDFLWVIDSNLAALKTDGVMVKRINYAVDTADPERPVATVTLRYTNNGPGIGKDFRFTRYRDYVRLYVPEGAQLLEVQGAMKDDRYRTGGRVVPGAVDVYRELGKTVFGAFWSIEPKTTQEITFKYVLPPGVRDRLQSGTYRLDVQQQSGNFTELTLDLRFGKTLQRATPSEDAERFGDSRYQLETDTGKDRAFEIAF